MAFINLGFHEYLRYLTNTCIYDEWDSNVHQNHSLVYVSRAEASIALLDLGGSKAGCHLPNDLWHCHARDQGKIISHRAHHIAENGKQFRVLSIGTTFHGQAVQYIVAKVKGHERADKHSQGYVNICLNCTLKPATRSIYSIDISSNIILT